ncbi:MAG: right-handed parallel beta-helix repeat-containing protein [Bacteroidetes bacterium]|nr:right-handed parallel beta-helix repeat-containing protein [Bacteroidota bacterium]
MILRLFLLACLLPAMAAEARVLFIGDGGYAGLEAAAADARPGDTIMFRSGVFAGGAFVADLQGRPDAWITITGEAGARIQGGTSAFQLTDPAYLRISGLVFEGQTGNGLNIDDGGSYDTPARHLLIENCEWRSLAATGNNDQLKMSGVDSFTVRNCRFVDGSPGGSMIDMVGCHAGAFENNTFENAGSNCIQAKGGTQYIRIERNRFFRGGQRAINIGGSTGLPYFRPIDAPFEASHIFVAANVFTGAVAPIAYVGAVNCAVVHNTIYLPEKWVVRILQESTDARFVACGNNTFMNNIIVLGNAAAAPTFNIGANTAPETFQFRNNLWYNVDNAAWGGPNTPTPDLESIVGRDPLLRAPAMSGGDFGLESSSPAIGRGTPMSAPLVDFLGRPFNVPPSIGAVEGNPPVSGIIGSSAPETVTLELYPQPARSVVNVSLDGLRPGLLQLVVFDLSGRMLLWRSVETATASQTLRLDLAGARLAPGVYRLLVSDGTQSVYRPLLILR